MGGGSPQRVVKPPENRAGIGLPAPPQIDGQLVEAIDALREWREVRVSRHYSWAFMSDANVVISMLPPDTTATTLPVPARPLSAAAIAQPAAPSAMTWARSATSAIALAPSVQRTNRDAVRGTRRVHL